MATKRPLSPEELAENDNMQQLRQQVHQIMKTHISHEARGTALRELMASTQRLLSAASSPQVMKARLQKSTAGVKPKLESLPVELVESIACYLTKWSFGAFRLASKTLHDKSSHVFTKRFCEQRSIKLEWESLRQLALIFTRPNLLQALKHLVIDVEGECDFLAGARTTHSQDWQSPWRPDDSSKAKSLMYMLDRTFSRLSNPVTIEFRSDSRHAMSSHAVAMVLAAIASSRTKVHALHLGGGGLTERGNYHDHDKRMFTIWEQDEQDLRRCFEGLKMLELSWVQPRSARSECQFVNALCSSAPNLETLTVWELQLEDGAYYLDCIRTQLQMLKVLTMFDIPVVDGNDKYGGCLVRFVQRCAPKLEQLHVWKYREQAAIDAKFVKKLEDRLTNVKVILYEQSKEGKAILST